MLNYSREVELPALAGEGHVVIQALSTPYLTATADLLAESFVATASKLTPFAKYLRRNIVRYLTSHQGMPPDAVVLIAVLYKEGDEQKCEEAQDGEALAGETQDGASEDSNSNEVGSSSSSSSLDGSEPLGLVIGSTEVSFNPITRSTQPFLDAPTRCAYICNMAVAPAFRRKGIASKLLQEAEELAARVMGEREMYLHLRFVDQEAAALYDRAGFAPAAEHWPLVPLFGIQRLKLMRKRIELV